MGAMFAGAAVFNHPIGAWNTSSVKNMSCMFCHTIRFSQPLGSWDTSAVSDMSWMFYRSKYHEDIGSWNTAAVTDMSFMFCGSVFNYPLSSWNTSSVTTMRGMFLGSYFWSDISTWDTSAVQDMSLMFFASLNFNKRIGGWNTRAVTNMSFMFAGRDGSTPCGPFTQWIGAWDTSAVQDMSSMFAHACSFNVAIGSWNTSAVRNMHRMFAHTYHFNQPIFSWATASVTDMSQMFMEAVAFNQPLDTWDTSAVTDMRGMFQLATNFNQPLQSWVTSDVTNMSDMFRGAESFNQPLDTWNTSSVTSMRSMFRGAVSFNQELSSWHTSSVLDMDHIFTDADALELPPCLAGRFPARNGLGCQDCPVGQYAAARAVYCRNCGKTAVPVRNRSSCQPCPSYHYVVPGHETCSHCNFPFVLIEGDCIWWHLPVSGLCVFILLLIWWMMLAHLHREKSLKMEAATNLLYRDLWDDFPASIAGHRAVLRGLGLDADDVDRRISDFRARQSLEAGVSMRYLLSHEFEQLATERSGKSNPTFMDLKTAFWLCRDPVGQHITCPRDGRPGCALVDWIPRRDRREQTHFMSWTWQYSLQQIRSALEMYGAMFSSTATIDAVFFYMCFFANNQFRIIVEQSTTGSADLECTFENSLKRIGLMVAILDTWEEPVYLTRIWTVYEQFVASTLDVSVTFIMPEQAMNYLHQQISRGADGISAITDSLSRVDSAQATAWDKADEEKVKSLIQTTVGFHHVDTHVTDVMVRWIGEVVKQKFSTLVHAARKTRADSPSARASQIEMKVFNFGSCNSQEVSKKDDGSV